MSDRDEGFVEIRGAIDDLDQRTLALLQRRPATFCSLSEQAFAERCRQRQEPLGGGADGQFPALLGRLLREAVDTAAVAAAPATDEDAVDSLLNMIETRTSLARRIGKAKQQGGMPLYDPAREQLILQRLMRLNRDSEMPLQELAARAVFREIISLCRAAQGPRLSIACLGPSGTFSEEAAKLLFGHAMELQLLGNIPQIFNEVEAQTADYGVAPVENSSLGILPYTLNCLLDSRLQICAEIMLPIQFALLMGENSSGDGIRSICGHPQALSQCRQYLKTHWPDVRQRAVDSNGEAARLAAERSDYAALAGEQAAAVHGLRVVAREVQDRPDNCTCFWVFAAVSGGYCPGVHYRTAIIVTAKDHPGALYQMLGVFADAGLNLTRLYSWPSARSRGQCCFFIELDGHANTPEISAVLNEMKDRSIGLQRLGSYPCVGALAE